MTVTDYLTLDRESDIKHEFVDGQVYAMSDASPEHILITTNLTGMLHAALQKVPAPFITAICAFMYLTPPITPTLM